jgi:hypothetical protein
MNLKSHRGASLLQNAKRLLVEPLFAGHSSRKKNISSEREGRSKLCEVILMFGSRSQASFHKATHLMNA